MARERDHVGFFGAYAIRNCRGIEDVRGAVGAIEKVFLKGSALGRLEIVENVGLGCHRFLCFVMCHVSVPFTVSQLGSDGLAGSVSSPSRRSAFCSSSQASRNFSLARWSRTRR